MATTIQLDERTKHKLEEMKVFPRETYNQVIDRLVKTTLEEEHLSAETIRNIEHSLEDIKRGKTYSTDEAKKRLGIK